MRLVTYREGRDRPAVVVSSPEGDRLLDLSGIAPRVETILADDALLAQVRAAVETADAASLPALASAALAAPVTPGKILCLGYNYRGHVPDGADPAANDPEWPDVFVKTPNTLAGPGAPVVIPPGATDVDYEGEVAIVIGRRAQRVPIEDALSHVGGYTILNDVSDRAWQRRQSQWALGKCSDGFAPLGPWVVTPDEVPDPQELLVEVVRDGVVTVSQSTSTTIFSVAFVIHHLSQVLTLEPGDVVSTGTPQKLPGAQQAHRPLADGDAVTVRISRIGELTTRFVAAPDAPSRSYPARSTTGTPQEVPA
ncbi:MULTISPECIES: fumarylacetoacetate hydrolase family protein [unclassified Leifsonia]|uniref:fumarylacetoacetate hydrolase family protein n=1 Tax=unclassified Leifsonia TaxID=2663824 RepID=UPI0008A75DAC|nr:MULTISPECIES: fumarylacetoacetate hydrolase family protein [unclassified Leifsonia]SEI11305.1 2-keto-4-pentenoate hydratase/2-oxohepta-3-ene-1,7-dioic acid hydratase (catechol pathway) [Leifsonia sp. CL154]SFL88760.1 2-keto-4-pentenoate hydratase/2-oxohepta-3-ene-1,7-dioic acid hydratase (catechol pathway) [Leifsonia sp. CL147]